MSEPGAGTPLTDAIPQWPSSLREHAEQLEQKLTAAHQQLATSQRVCTEAVEEIAELRQQLALAQSHNAGLQERVARQEALLKTMRGKLHPQWGQHIDAALGPGEGT